MYFASQFALKALIILGVVAVVYTKAPRFLYPPKTNYTVLEGSKIKLKCAVTGVNDPDHNRTLTAWRKMGVPPRNSIIRKRRYWDRFKVKNGKFLRIRNVKLQDAGLYRCIAKNQHGMVEAVIKLEVLARRGSVPSTNVSHHVATVQHSQKPQPTAAFKAPRFHDKQIIHAIKRTKGKLLRLPCRATGTPRPKIRWSKNNNKMKRRKRVRIMPWTVVIRRLRVSDSGIYQCVVWNKHGNATRTFFVQVIGKDLQDHPIEQSSSLPDKPKPIIQKHLLKNATVLEGQPVTFSCTALSHEVPKFTWLKWTTFNHSNDIPPKIIMLNSSEPNVRFVRELTRKTGRLYYSHKLKLLNVSKADQGRYTCVVGSTGGIVSAHVYLTVHLKRQKEPNEEPQRKSTAEPPNSLDGIPIPLAALIAVPASLVTLLIVAIIWCYIQIARHRKQLQKNSSMYSPVANGKTAANGSLATQTNLKYKAAMQTFTNGHVTHEPWMEMRQRPEVAYQPEITYSMEVTHVPEVTQSMETPKSSNYVQGDTYSEFPICPKSLSQQNQNLTSEASTKNDSISPRCHHGSDITSELNTSTTVDHNTSNVVCLGEKLQDCSRTYCDDHKTRNGDDTCRNSEPQNNTHIDQHSTKSSDV